MDRIKSQIHSTNINGLGAIQVVMSFLKASRSLNKLENSTIFLSENADISDFESGAGNLVIYKRKLPNSVSRLIECVFSNFIFPNIPTIVLGDIPLNRIHNQIVLVHQSNLVYPKINQFSSKSLKFKINRFLFAMNHKYAKNIIVQTGAMAEEMIQSYPLIKNKIVVIPQPVPNWLKVEKTISVPKFSKLYLFYPAAFYPHKKHDFLLDIYEYGVENNLDYSDFEIWLTLTDQEFEPFKSIRFIKNLGRLNPKEMNEYYQKADALLFLSSMESYGLPLIESLTINLPIIVADFSYSRWVCEDSAYYFQPYSVKSFLEEFNFFKKNCLSENKFNYTQVLKKFPDKWEDVVNEFYHLLLK